MGQMNARSAPQQPSTSSCVASFSATKFLFGPCTFCQQFIAILGYGRKAKLNRTLQWPEHLEGSHPRNRAQTVARELLSELKSASTQQQDSPPSAGMLNLSASLQQPRIKRSKRCRFSVYMSCSLISSNGMLPFGILAQQHWNSLLLLA